MVRVTASVVKLLALLILFYMSLVSRQPLVLITGLAFLCWIYIVTRGWKRRALATLGFALIALGWWAYLRSFTYLLYVEGSHFSSDGEYWGRLAQMSFRGNVVLTTLGVVLMVGADYRRRAARATIVSNASTTVDDDGAWPPPPQRQPH